MSYPPPPQRSPGLCLAVVLVVAAGLSAPLFPVQPPPRSTPATPPRAAAPVGVTAPSRPPALETRISLSVKDADLVEVVRSLARIGGKNVVVDPSVRGTVTAELHDVPWDRALAVILEINGLGMELDGNVIAVAPPARLHMSP